MPGEVTECRICSGEAFEPVLDLGQVPPVDSFLDTETEHENFYPLETVICQDCKLVQLNHVVPKEELFHDDYAYDMSVTGAGVEHFHEMAREIDRQYPGFNKVLDIGSNTGVLLEGFAEQGWSIIGIEPSDNVCQKAVERGIPTENTFFSASTAKRVVDHHGKMDVVTATNVFAHIEDLHDAVSGVKKLLNQDGVFVFEVPYLVDLVEKNEFDTIYHEHLSYFSVKPLVNLFERHGMEIIDIEKQEIHGGSIRVHVARKGERNSTMAVEDYLELEREKGIHTTEKLREFRQRVEENQRKLVEMVEEISESSSIAGVGAPAKGVTLLNYCGLDSETIPYVSEKSEIKIGKYIPGTNNKVVSDQTLLERQPDYALLLPWNFAEPIIENLEDYVRRGGKFIIPVPEPRIVGKEKL